MIMTKFNRKEKLKKNSFTYKFVLYFLFYFFFTNECTMRKFKTWPQPPKGI